VAATNAVGRLNVGLRECVGLDEIRRRCIKDLRERPLRTGPEVLIGQRLQRRREVEEFRVELSNLRGESTKPAETVNLATAPTMLLREPEIRSLRSDSIRELFESPKSTTLSDVLLESIC
jgi:hypothetical protein